MIFPLRKLWRGDIPLPKTFWLFGVAPSLVFPFIFISLQPVLSSFLKKYSNTFFDLDCLLVAIFVFYGASAIVATWRSSKKYHGSKKVHHLAKVSIIVIFLWFTANMSIYVFIRTFIPVAFEDQLDYAPKKLRLSASDLKSDSIYLSGFTLKFPFYKEDIKHVSPGFIEHQLRSAIIFLAHKNGEIIFDQIPDALPKAKTTVMEKVTNWFFDEKIYQSYFKTMGQVHYASLKNYSWWNVPHNVKLTLNLTLKIISIPAFGDLTLYDVQTPYLRGYLRIGHMKNNHTSMDFQFESERKTYSVHVLTSNGEIVNRMNDIVSSIQLIDNTNESLRAMQLQYNKKESKYPDDLLLLCLISLKGPTLSDLKELLRVEKNIPNNQYTVSHIGVEVYFLSSAEQEKK